MSAAVMLPFVPFGLAFGGRGVAPRRPILFVLFPPLSVLSSSPSFCALVGELLSLADRASGFSFAAMSGLYSGCG